MMKNKKLIVVFILVIALLLSVVSFTKASDDVEELPTIVTEPNDNKTPQGSDNEEVANKENNTIANKDTNTSGANTKNNANTSNKNTLPQTGVQGDTTLFVFIAICITSAIYAYFKIRKYNNIH